MLCPIPEELERELFKNPWKSPKIKKIARTKKDFFFARELKAQGEILKIDTTVQWFDRFQNTADAQNEFRKILFKPLLALQLASTHLPKAVFQLIFVLIDLITYEPPKSTFFQTVEELGTAIFYALYSVALFVDALLAFTLRCAISIVQESLDVVFEGLKSVLADVAEKQSDTTEPDEDEPDEPVVDGGLQIGMR